MIWDGRHGNHPKLHERNESKSYSCTIFGTNSMAIAVFSFKQVLRDCWVYNKVHFDKGEDCYYIKTVRIG